MDNEKNEINILFLQARDDEMSEHEFLCFDRMIDVPQENFFRVNVFTDEIGEHLLEGKDAVILAGTGRYVKGGGHPESLPQIMELLKIIRAKQIPLLAIGYGHEVMALTFGGTVVQDEKLKEIGSIEMKKTLHGVTDQLLGDLPESFHVQIGHNHSVTKVPEGAVDLVSSVNPCCEAFVFPGEPIYAFQFHPELDHSDVVIRLTYYERKYFLHSGEREEVTKNLKRSPHANRIPNLFIEKVVKKIK